VHIGSTASGTTCIAGSSTPVAGANRPYLRGNWTGGAYDQNPAARVRFGVFKGAEEVIFIRENF
jgi:MSHA biogenesis protein MshQ